jgi:hypothetical protein
MTGEGQTSMSQIGSHAGGPTPQAMGKVRALKRTPVKLSIHNRVTDAV